MVCSLALGLSKRRSKGPLARLLWLMRPPVDDVDPGLSAVSLYSLPKVLRYAPSLHRPRNRTPRTSGPHEVLFPYYLPFQGETSHEASIDLSRVLRREDQAYIANLSCVGSPQRNPRGWWPRSSIDHQSLSVSEMCCAFTNLGGKEGLVTSKSPRRT